MENKFKDLGNGITIIYCDDREGNTTIEVYVDTILMSIIKKRNVYWKAYTKDGGLKIAAYEPETGGIINLLTLIGAEIYGTNCYFALVNDNFFDLRIENILPYRKTKGHGRGLTKLKQEALKTLVPLEERIEMKVSHPIIIFEYFERLRVIENGKLKYDFDEITYGAIKKYLSGQVTYPMSFFEDADSVIIIFLGKTKYEIDKAIFNQIGKHIVEQKKLKILSDLL